VSPAAPDDQGESQMVNYERWPDGKAKPFSLFLVGSPNDNVPLPMKWTSGRFTCTIVLGSDAMEVFQLIENKDWDRAYYPSVPDAGNGVRHRVLGPDDESDGRTWLIGAPDGSVGLPGDKFDVVAVVDANARVVQVGWQLSRATTRP